MRNFHTNIVFLALVLISTVSTVKEDLKITVFVYNKTRFTAVLLQLVKRKQTPVPLQGVPRNITGGG